MDFHRSVLQTRWLLLILLIGFFLVAPRLSFSIALSAAPSDNEATVTDDAQWQRMLSELKKPENAYFDTALAYLDWVRQSPVSSPEFEDRADYEVAMIHLAALEQQKPFLSWEEHRQQIAACLQRFVENHSDGMMAFEAHMVLARIAVDAGSQTMQTLAGSTSLSEEEKQKPRREAREHFQDALVHFEAALSALRDLLTPLQNSSKAKNQPEEIATLERLRRQFLATLHSSIQTKEFLAETLPENSSEYRREMTVAAEEYLKMAKDYAHFDEAMEAKMAAAKIFKELTHFDRCRELLGELNTLRGESYQHILTESLILALEMSLEEKKPEVYRDAIERARNWNESVPEDAKLTPQGQKILLLSAKNMAELAQTLRDDKNAQTVLRNDANGLLQKIGDENALLVQQAKTLLTEMGFVAAPVPEPADAKNFVAAKAAADRAWNDFVSANREREKESKATDDSTEETAREIKTQNLGQQCFQAIQFALSLKTLDTPASDVHDLQIHLAKLLATQERYLEAAIVYDYLAHHIEDSVKSLEGAQQGIQCYRLFFAEEAKTNQNTSAVSQRLERLATFVQQQLEADGRLTQTAQTAASSLRQVRLEAALAAGQFDEARRLLSEIPAGTTQHRAAELALGQALWNNYVTKRQTQSATPSTSEPAGDKAELEELAPILTEAKTLLKNGIRIQAAASDTGRIHLSPGNADRAAVGAAMILAQICMEQGEPQEALQWLDHAEWGPLTWAETTMTDSDRADAEKASMFELVQSLHSHALMLALRGYVEMQDFDKAEVTMQKLEAMTPTNEAEKNPLMGIYVQIGLGLETRLKTWIDASEFDHAEKVIQGFDLFLNRISSQDNASFQVLYWTADTFFRLGNVMSARPNAKKQSLHYYQMAAQVFERIATTLEEHQDVIDEDRETSAVLLDSIKVRMAESLRAAEMYEKALGMIEELLQEKNRLVLQFEAAKTLEDWGKVDPSKYALAITGRFPSNRILGWSGIIRQTRHQMQDSSEFENAYYEAQCGKFRCALEQARMESDAAKQQLLLRGIRNDFLALVSLHPELGGAENYAKLDELYKNFEFLCGVNESLGIASLFEEIGDPAAAVNHVAATNEDRVSTARNQSAEHSPFIQVAALSFSVLLFAVASYWVFRQGATKTRRSSATKNSQKEETPIRIVVEKTSPSGSVPKLSPKTPFVIVIKK